MKTAALLLCLLALVACEKKRSTDPAEPRTSAMVPAGQRPAVPSSPDPSVPSATSVFVTPPASTAKDEAAAKVTSNETLTRTQESNTMPMPGQVNNHSTPSLDPANTRRAASAP
ncbi:MAG: hypothetical protein V4792_09405 [Pseudomonadota bacterium]